MKEFAIYLIVKGILFLGKIVEANCDKNNASREKIALVFFLKSLFIKINRPFVKINKAFVKINRAFMNVNRAFMRWNEPFVML